MACIDPFVREKVPSIKQRNPEDTMKQVNFSKKHMILLSTIFVLVVGAVLTGCYTYTVTAQNFDSFAVDESGAIEVSVKDAQYDLIRMVKGNSYYEVNDRETNRFIRMSIELRALPEVLGEDGSVTFELGEELRLYREDGTFLVPAVLVVDTPNRFIRGSGMFPVFGQQTMELKTTTKPYTIDVGFLHTVDDEFSYYVIFGENYEFSPEEQERIGTL